MARTYNSKNSRIFHNISFNKSEEELMVNNRNRRFSAVSQNGYLIKKVPEDQQEENLCIVAVLQNGMALRYVINQTLDICLAAVAQNGAAFQYVKEEFRTPEIYRIALSSCGKMLRHIPAKDQTEEMCLLATRENPYSLRYVSKQFLKDVMVKTVTNDGFAIKYIPTPNEDDEDEFRFYMELVKLSVKQNGMALKFIPKEYQTPSVCKAAIKNNPESFQYVINQTLDICMYAVKVDGKLIKNVAEKYKAKCSLTAVKQNWRCFEDVVQSRAVCLAAVEQYGMLLEYVNPEFVDEDMCLAAVKQTGFALPFVPTQTEAICLEAVRKDGTAIKFCDRSFVTDELKMIAVKSDPYAIRYIKNPSEKLCKIAMRGNVGSMNFINPEILQTVINNLIENSD